MKRTTLTLALVALIGCHHDKPTVAKTTPDPVADKAAPEATKPAPQVTQDQKVSPTLAISSDLLAQCGIKVPTPAAGTPKFDYDKDELTPDDRNVLDQLATCLTAGALKGKPVSLIGRADPRGTEEYNLGLGSRRSATVGKYLSRLGVAEPQLAVTTRGALDATGTDEASWQNDRRVDIQLKVD